MSSRKGSRSSKYKDFGKAKLKVGKLKTKAANLTSTEFRVGSIYVKDQSLREERPSTATQLYHHVNLLGSNSDIQRQESLRALTNATSSQDLPASIVLEKCLPLIVDGSGAVREHLLKLLQALPAHKFAGWEERLILHIQTGLSHISRDVCNSSISILQCMVLKIGFPLICYQSAFFKLLKSFFTLFGWNTTSTHRQQRQNGWIQKNNTLEKMENDSKLVCRALDIFAKILYLGLFEPQRDRTSEALVDYFESHHGRHHISQTPKAYSCLSLFRDRSKNASSDGTGSVDSRRKFFDDNFRGALTAGLGSLQQRGGDIGRQAAAISKIILEIKSHS